MNINVQCNKGTSYYRLNDARVKQTTNEVLTYEGWNFNSGNYLFTTDTK